jgi:hypothetical protein
MGICGYAGAGDKTALVFDSAAGSTMCCCTQ